MKRESLADLSAADMTAGYRRREFTPVDVFEATTARIDEVNPALNAFVVFDLQRAKKAAEESTTRWAAGESLGLADGIPATVKDTMDLAGWPTRKGSLHSDPNKIAKEDSPMARRLREGGALILGKTTAPEYGWKGASDSPYTGLTRNPWNLNRTTGGSSAGAAAAAATGMGKFNTGSDGAGSVRIPAAFTGVFTIKPTFSVIPIHPPSTGGLLSYVGPITQTVTDAAHAMSVVAKPDPRATFQSRLDERSWIDGLEAGIEGLKVAYAPTWSFRCILTSPSASKMPLMPWSASVQTSRPSLPISRCRTSNSWRSGIPCWRRPSATSPKVSGARATQVSSQPHAEGWRCLHLT